MSAIGDTMTAEPPAALGPRGAEGEPRAEGASVRAEVVSLVRQRRYEEALAVLYRALSASPGERELVASVAQIKEFLAVACANRLGGLDRVAGPIPLTAATSPDAIVVARYIDGVATFDDIAHACPLGRLRTLQVLVALYSRAGARPAAGTSGDGPAPAGEAPEARPSDAPVSGVRPPGAFVPGPAEGETPGGDEGEAASRAPGAPALLAPSPVAFAGDPPSPNDRASVAPSVAVATLAGRRPAAGSVAIAGPEGGEGSRWGLPAAPPRGSEEDKRFREAFARGTAAFVRGRYAEAAAAFAECARLRPDDRPAATMLVRSLRGVGA